MADAATDNSAGKMYKRGKSPFRRERRRDSGTSDPAKTKISHCTPDVKGFTGEVQAVREINYT